MAVSDTKHADVLGKRHVHQKRGHWYRTIDRVHAELTGTHTERAIRC